MDRFSIYCLPSQYCLCILCLCLFYLTFLTHMLLPWIVGNRQRWTPTDVSPMCGHDRHWKRKLTRTHWEAGRQKVIAGSDHKKCFPKQHLGWDGIPNVRLSVRLSGKPPTRLLLKPDKNWLMNVHSPRAAANHRVGVRKKKTKACRSQKRWCLRFPSCVLLAIHNIMPEAKEMSL